VLALAQDIFRRIRAVFREPTVRLSRSWIKLRGDGGQQESSRYLDSTLAPKTKPPRM
jgi:hypothetical protein